MKSKILVGLLAAVVLALAPRDAQAQSRKRDDGSNRERPQRTERQQEESWIDIIFPDRDRNDDRRRDDDDRYAGGKAKCGVRGCQHPGRHEGLHKKQDRVKALPYPGERGNSRYEDDDDDDRAGNRTPRSGRNDDRREDSRRERDDDNARSRDQRESPRRQPESSRTSPRRKG